MLTLVVITFLILLLTYFFIFSKSTSNPEKEEEKNKKTENFPQTSSSTEKIEKDIQDDKPKIDISKYLFKTIKEGKDMTKCYFYKNGHIILFCDDKRINLCYLKNLKSPNHKIFSKSIEKDTIVDVSYAPEKKRVFCASKNSKSILSYNLEKIDGKIKLNKSEKVIKCDRPYEIKSLVSNDNGELISTIGTNDDTEIQIYDPNTLDIKFKESNGAIKNFQILFENNSSNLLISTFMNDICVINCEKTDKFNNESKIYENFYKFKRERSISGFKSKLEYFCLSNDQRFFAVLCDDKTIKIFRNYGNMCEAKFFSQISLEHSATIISLYVESFESERLYGYIGVGDGRNIYLYDTNGKLILELNEAHEGNIISLLVTKSDLNSEGYDEEIKSLEINNKNAELIIISAGNCGKIKFWKMMN